jgi:O-acetyl-ADP-ribose deacetylase (regulator of RNase III)
LEFKVEDLKLILVDPKVDFCVACKERFADLPNVEIVNSRFEKLAEFDCIVSAANSFGLMDGGVDFAIINFFGSDLESRVQQRIITEYLGEQPVGTSFIIETGNPKHPFVAHTPTMRVPMTISRTDNVYLAMWAMLLAVRKHNQTQEKKIKIVACPGLGTATGQVPANQATKQMALAYRHFLNPPSRLDWPLATKRQEEIRYGGDDGFLFPPDLDF